MIHLSEYIKLTELDTQQVMQNLSTAYIIRRRMKSSQPEFYANVSLSSQVLFSKHYLTMHLGEYPVKL